MSDEAMNLAELHGGVWGEHPDYPISDWKYEVANDDTRQGYWGWVLHQIENSVPLVRLLSGDTVAAEPGEGDQPPGPWQDFERRFGGITLFDCERNRASDDPNDGDVMWGDLPDEVDPAHVWTIVETDKPDRCYIVAGVQRVNSVGYVIAVRPRSGNAAQYREYIYEEP
jgi:hypothetical protein